MIIGRTDYPSEPEHGQAHYAQRLMDFQEELVELRDFFETTQQNSIKRRLNKAIYDVGKAANRIDDMAKYGARERNLESKRWRRTS